MTSSSDENRKSFDKSYFPQQTDVLNIVLDNIAQGMVVVGPDYRTLAFNRRFEDIFQLPSGTVEVGVDFRDILKIWATVAGQNQQMLERAISQLDEPSRFEFEFSQLIHGKLRWCLLTHNPLPTKGCVRTFTDITSRKQAEEDLKESQEQLKTVVEKSPFAMALVNMKGDIEYINLKAIETFGYLPQDIPNMDRWWEQAYPDKTYRDQVVTQWMGLVNEALLNKHEIEKREYRVTCKDGAVKIVTIFGVWVGDKVLAVFDDITERKKAEKLLRENEIKYRTIIDVSPVPYALNDDKQNITYLNKAFISTFGYTLEDIPTLSDWFPKAYPDTNYRQWVATTWQSRLEKARQESTSFEPMEVVIRCKDNMMRTVIAGAASLEKSFEGTHLVILYDISERKRMEVSLRVSEEKFKFLFDTMAQGVIVQDAQNKIVEANLAACKILGLTMDQLLGKTVYDPRWKLIREDGSLLPAEDMPSSIALRTGRFVLNSYFGVYLPEQNHYHWILTNSVPRFIPGEDKPSSTITTFTDISERKKAEEEYSTILRTAMDGFLIADVKGNILEVNDAYCALTGYRREELLAMDLSRVEAMMKPEEIQLRIPQIIEQGWARFESKHRRKDGGLVDVEISINYSPEKGGRLISFLRDITEHKKLEDQLRQAQKMESIGTLAGGIAHDFNNILTAIVGYGNIALMKMAKDDPQRLNIQHMLDAGDRAAHLTKDLLLFSRKQISERKPVDLNDIIQKVQKFLKRVIGEDIDCRTMLSYEQLTILGDDHQLEQVLMNLATNARDAMSVGGVFTITTKLVRLDKVFISVHGYGKPGNYALATISDTGQGMDVVTREHIFEPFFTTKEVGKGTGLGLAVVYGIIKQHEGFINVYSETGRGTTFTIYLPIIASSVHNEKITIEEPPIGGTETILFAEDNDAVRNVTRTVLEQFGYAVIVATDGQDAVTKYRENKDKIHLLLFDLVMPKKTGKEAYDEIRALTPGIKVLFASGYAPDMIRQKVLLVDRTPVIFKPVTPTKLLKNVREVLDQVK